MAYKSGQIVSKFFTQALDAGVFSRHSSTQHYSTDEDMLQ
jgi:hypothetical protein